jgi:hypothetical protein
MLDDEDRRSGNAASIGHAEKRHGHGNSGIIDEMDRMPPMYTQIP